VLLHYYRLYVTVHVLLEKKIISNRYSTPYIIMKKMDMASHFGLILAVFSTGAKITVHNATFVMSFLGDDSLSHCRRVS
jgi:hypothetical protein